MNHDRIAPTYNTHHGREPETVTVHILRIATEERDFAFFMRFLMSLAYIHIRVSGDMLLRLCTRFPLRGCSRMAARALSGYLVNHSRLFITTRFDIISSRRIRIASDSLGSDNSLLVAGRCCLSIPCITQLVFITFYLTRINLNNRKTPRKSRFLKIVLILNNKIIQSNSLYSMSYKQQFRSIIYRANIQ